MERDQVRTRLKAVWSGPVPEDVEKVPGEQTAQDEPPVLTRNSVISDPAVELNQKDTCACIRHLNISIHLSVCLSVLLAVSRSALPPPDPSLAEHHLKRM